MTLIGYTMMCGRQVGSSWCAILSSGYSGGGCQLAPTTVKSWLTKMWCGQLTPML
jgi:hypothetical protein